MSGNGEGEGLGVEGTYFATMDVICIHSDVSITVGYNMVAIAATTTRDDVTYMSVTEKQHISGG